MAAPPTRLLIIGAGSRGKVYSRYGLEHPDLCTVVGVAEPREYHRMMVANWFKVPQENLFLDWQEAAAREKFADAVVIATQDNMHADPAVAFANKGYHILLEKPMAVSEEDCRRIVAAVKANGVQLAVGHVLRYTPCNMEVARLVREGRLGEVMSVQHLEPVGFYHFAHSYVRGNWRKEADSTFMLMAKACHDVDLVRFFVGQRFSRVSSFGSLQHFNAAHRPDGAAKRCLDCPVENTCPYSALKIYLEPVRAGHKGWPVKIITPAEPSEDSVLTALREGDYGRCVYDHDNDVVDHQVVNFEFEQGATASLTVVACTEKICSRRTCIYGSKAQLEVEDNVIRVYDFLSRETTVIHPPSLPAGVQMEGHGGADYFLMKGFIAAIRNNDPSQILSGPDETLESHLATFAAERARKEGTVVSM